MKSITNYVALLLCFFIFISSVGLINASNEKTLVSKACEKAKFKDLCISSLKAEHASKDATDLSALALIAIKVATNKGSDTSVYVKKTLDEDTLEPSVEQDYEDCSENYISAMQQLDDSVEALVSKNYKDVKTFLDAAIDAAITCDSGLKQGAGKDSDLFKKNEMFRQLCTNALDIVNHLDTK